VPVGLKLSFQLFDVTKSQAEMEVCRWRPEALQTCLCDGNESVSH
jgi:hypothetical protein